MALERSLQLVVNAYRDRGEAVGLTVAITKSRELEGLPRSDWEAILRTRDAPDLEMGIGEAIQSYSSFFHLDYRSCSFFGVTNASVTFSEFVHINGLPKTSWS